MNAKQIDKLAAEMVEDLDQWRAVYSIACEIIGADYPHLSRAETMAHAYTAANSLFPLAL